MSFHLFTLNMSIIYFVDMKIFILSKFGYFERFEQNIKILNKKSMCELKFIKKTYSPSGSVFFRLVNKKINFDMIAKTGML